MRFVKLLLVLALAILVSCANARNEARGFRLADNGDPQHGKAVFQEFGCIRCHQVEGSALPQPTIQNIALGGSVLMEPSDGYLVTAIINPRYHAARYPRSTASTTVSGMPDFAERMTVQQLTDIVAYLKSRYALRPLAVRQEYP